MSTSTRSRERTKALEKKATLEPKDAELTTNLGEAYLREGRLDEAARIYARAAELDPRTEFRALYWEWLGLVRESRGELEQALEAYDNWADAEPWSVEPVDRAGTLLVALGRWTDLALLRSQYERRAEGNSDPGLRESMALFSYVMEQLGSTEDPPPMARTFAALEVESRSIAMRYLLGVLFMRGGHLEAAAAEFLRVLELDSDRTWVERRFSLGWRAATAWLMLGRLARLQGQIPEALQHLQSCLQTSTDSLEPLEELASLLVEQGAYQEALELLPPAPEELDLPPWIRRLRARCLLGLGRVDEAARLVAPVEPTPAAHPEPTSAPDRRLQSRLQEGGELLAARRFQEALDLFASLGSPRKRPPEARLGLARANAGLAHWKEAVRHLEILVREQPAFLEAWRLLAEAYQATGQPLRRRLAQVQMEAVALGYGPHLAREWLAPAPQGSGSPGLGVSARALPGEGRLTVTGIDGAEAAAHIAWTWLRAEAISLGLPDPSSRDAHVHVRALGTVPVPSDDEEETPPGWPSAAAAPETCGEDAGLAVLAALATALAERSPSGRTVVAGRLDLSGGVHGSATMVAGLARLREAGMDWDRLVAPRTMATELHRLPEEIWTGADLELCANAAQALQYLRDEEPACCRCTAKTWPGPWPAPPRKPTAWGIPSCPPSTCSWACWASPTGAGASSCAAGASACASCGPRCGTWWAGGPGRPKASFPPA